jgi:hypothetical protein
MYSYCLFGHFKVMRYRYLRVIHSCLIELLQQKQENYSKKKRSCSFMNPNPKPNHIHCVYVRAMIIVFYIFIYLSHFLNKLLSFIKKMTTLHEERLDAYSVYLRNE